MPDGCYVYCVIASPRQPRRARVARGLPGTGRVRVLDADGGFYLAVGDAPLSQYGATAINSRLADLEWVSRAAVAHERVVESFNGSGAVLPMKLFTVFRSDTRALEHIRSQRKRLAALAKRVAGHDEWSVRVVHDQARVDETRTRGEASSDRTGAAYLARKKARRDAAAELAARAREAVASLYDRLAKRARLAKRRGASELPVEGGPLLLDAAFLVGRARTASFRALLAREARSMSRRGYGVTLTGPWPPYSFVQD
jgi:hypothetical protein